MMDQHNPNLDHNANVWFGYKCMLCHKKGMEAVMASAALVVWDVGSSVGDMLAGREQHLLYGIQLE